jgi:hypothetical protein
MPPTIPLILRRSDAKHPSLEGRTVRMQGATSPLQRPLANGAMRIAMTGEKDDAIAA